MALALALALQSSCFATAIFYCWNKWDTLLGRIYISIIFYIVHLLKHFICLRFGASGWSKGWELQEYIHSGFVYTQSWASHNFMFCVSCVRIAINAAKVTNQRWICFHLPFADMSPRQHRNSICELESNNLSLPSLSYSSFRFFPHLPRALLTSPIFNKCVHIQSTIISNTISSSTRVYEYH